MIDLFKRLKMQKRKDTESLKEIEELLEKILKELRKKTDKKIDDLIAQKLFKEEGKMINFKNYKIKQLMFTYLDKQSYIEIDKDCNGKYNSYLFQHLANKIWYDINIVLSQKKLHELYNDENAV